jgi:hypothetical protein
MLYKGYFKSCPATLFLAVQVIPSLIVYCVGGTSGSTIPQLDVLVVPIHSHASAQLLGSVNGLLEVDAWSANHRHYRTHE